MGKHYRSKQFLTWAKRQAYSSCCLCREKLFEELHHFADKGIGQKCSDLFVCRVCRDCHEEIQGKRKIALGRLGRITDWISMQEDALDLLAGYVRYIESLTVEQDDDSEVF